jgi:hypothetical protein
VEDATQLGFWVKGCERMEVFQGSFGAGLEARRAIANQKAWFETLKTREIWRLKITL